MTQTKINQRITDFEKLVNRHAMKIFEIGNASWDPIKERCDPSYMPHLDNASIAELLIREAEMTEGHRELAYRRAAHSAFMWPVEAAEVVNAGLSLTELVGVGPSLARKILRWFDSSPKVEPPPNGRNS